VIDVPSSGAEPSILYESGIGGLEVLPTAIGLLRRGLRGVSHQVGVDRRPLMIHPWTLPPGRPGALLLWRMPGARAWGQGDHAMAQIAGALLHVILTHGPAEAGIDRLTGVPNRDYFMEEVDRHIERLDKDGLPGTLVVVEMDGLTRVTESYGQPATNWLLSRMATRLRAIVRPADIVGRVSGDAFGLWLTGMDHMTAAERAESLRGRGLRLPDELSGGAEVTPTMFIGIASRQPGLGEDAHALLMRARSAAAEARKGDGDAWRVSLSPT
jgi:diguanylate cyclase (GGDEF)-like protein